VALVRGQVAGVGYSADDARRAAQASRPKEKPELRFITVDDWQSFPLLRHLWKIIQQHGADVLLVGGAVRDGLLGRPLHDLDYAVNGDATSLAVAIRRAFGGAVVPLDPERDVARVVLNHAGSRFYVDFARRQGANWETDLKARDFTVNAIAVDAASQYLDPMGGRGDLADGTLRATNEGAFCDDPLRTLRAVRLSAELGFSIETQTQGWIRRDAPLLTRVAGERIRDEFSRILRAQDAAQHLATMDQLNLLPQVLPEVAATRDIEQSPPHQWDVWTHTRMTIAAVEAILNCLMGKPRTYEDLAVPGWVWGDLKKALNPFRSALIAHLSRVISDTRDRRFALKQGALFHDVGKALTTTREPDGRIRFIGHEKEGADLAAKRMRALHFSRDEISLVHTIVAHHLRPGNLARSKGPTRRGIYRYFKSTGDAGIEIGLLSLADALATWGPTLPGRGWSRGLDVVATLLDAFFEKDESVSPTPIINGHQLMSALNLQPGPEIGRLLEAIREAQATGEISSRDEALKLAKELLPGE
jgi:putative nucleotidyltransferase with HDIG domain